MTFIIWTHWMGKWGLNNHRAGWAFLSWSFSFHVIGFVFLSGVFSHGYAAKGFDGLQRVFVRCLDLLIVYVAFSWLRGLADYLLASQRVGLGRVIVSVIKGTFMFHQGPWYLAALFFWRLSAMALWWVPALFAVSVVISIACPYHSLQTINDPCALREFLHYLPYFSLGLLCGRQRLESGIAFFGQLTPWIGAATLLVVAFVIWFPLSFLYEDESLRWILLKKDRPPTDAGGIWTMLALFAAKIAATCAALGLFSTPCGFQFVDRICEAAGKRSMTVYMVHMVFIMVPGDVLCVEDIFESPAREHGLAMTILLLVLAVVANLLCGSDFTAFIFRPVIEPLKTFRLLPSGRVKAPSGLPTAADGK